jgi:hypothetical protein
MSNGLHRVALPGTSWSVWRDVCVRSAGFPADMVLTVCDEPLARSADLDGRGPVFDKAYAEAVGQLSGAIADTHADPGFREAITWQNPVLAQFLRDHDAGPDAPRRSKQRQRELVIANYLQRYCLKNDTIGFFGPVGWVGVDPGTPGLTVTPGEQLIARRTTYFEVWASGSAICSSVSRSSRSGRACIGPSGPAAARPAQPAGSAARGLGVRRRPLALRPSSGCHRTPPGSAVRGR